VAAMFEGQSIPIPYQRPGLDWMTKQPWNNELTGAALKAYILHTALRRICLPVNSAESGASSQYPAPISSPVLCQAKAHFVGSSLPT
jgi:hypothetical protein